MARSNQTGPKTGQNGGVSDFIILIENISYNFLSLTVLFGFIDNHAAVFSCEIAGKLENV